MKRKSIFISIFLSFLIIWAISSPCYALEGRFFHPIAKPEKPDEGAKEIEAPGLKLPPLPLRKSCISLVRKVAASYGSGSFSKFLANDFPNAHYLLNTFQKIGITAQGIELQVQSIKNVHIEPWKVKKKEDKEGTVEYLLRSECIVQVRTRVHFDDSTTGAHIVRTFGHGKWHFAFFISESFSDKENKTIHLHPSSPGNGIDMPDGSRGALVYVQSEDIEGSLFEPDIIENFIFKP